MKGQLLEAIEKKHPPAGKSSITRVHANEYFDPEQFDRESRLLRSSAIPAAAARELSDEHSVFSFSYMGVPYLLTRAADGKVRAFINSCSHRGTRLLGPGKHKCKRAMVCPYHNWVFDLNGDRLATPHGYGFSEDIPGLREVPVIEKHGLLWLRPFAHDVDQAAAEPPELNFIPRENYEDWTVYRRTEAELACNWKLIVEGGLEFYHFKATHKDTIYPRFFDNQGLVSALDPAEAKGLVMHLPHRGILDGESTNSSPESYCHIVYYFFPGTVVLVEDNLINIIRIEPVAIDRTRTTTLHLVPYAKRGLTRFWDKRIAFTLKTLDEDNQRTTWIQQGLSARDPERWVHHGAFEYGLGMFHELLREAIAGY